MAGGTQSKYQVRFGWGSNGARLVGVGAHLLVWVDVLPPSDGTTGIGPTGQTADLPELLAVGLTDGRRVAERVASLQTEMGDRCIVAVIAKGGPNGAFAVEDLLGAGNVIDALVSSGIDHTSPEAAAACAAWSGLSRAAKHLVSASEHAVELEEAGRRDLVDRAIGRGEREHIGRA